MNLSLYELLKFFKKTHEEFARDMGVSVSTVQRWVNNKHKPLPLYEDKIKEVIRGYQEERRQEEEHHSAA